MRLCFHCRNSLPTYWNLWRRCFWSTEFYQVWAMELGQRWCSIKIRKCTLRLPCHKHCPKLSQLSGCSRELCGKLAINFVFKLRQLFSYWLKVCGAISIWLGISIVSWSAGSLLYFLIIHSWISVDRLCYAKVTNKPWNVWLNMINNYILLSPISIEVGQLSLSCHLHADTWGSEFLPSCGSAILGSFIFSCANEGEKKHKSRSLKNQARMWLIYLISAHIPLARIQSSDSNLTSWIVFKAKVENKMESDGHITVSLSPCMSVSHGKALA